MAVKLLFSVFEGDEIVSMINFKGRIILCTKFHIYELNADNSVTEIKLTKEPK